MEKDCTRIELHRIIISGKLILLIASTYSTTYSDNTSRHTNTILNSNDRAEKEKAHERYEQQTKVEY